MPGTLDANGIYLYSEDDPASPVSDLLNLGMDSTSDAVGALRSRVTALEAVPAMADLTPATNWDHYETTGLWSKAKWVKDRNGIVTLHGLFKCTAALGSTGVPQTLTILPVGARPASGAGNGSLIFTEYCTFATGGVTRVDINTVGAVQVQPVTGTNTYAIGSIVTISGISFMAGA